jgi:hypothetical protein
MINIVMFLKQASPLYSDVYTLTFSIYSGGDVFSIAARLKKARIKKYNTNSFEHV